MMKKIKTLPSSYCSPWKEKEREREKERKGRAESRQSAAKAATSPSLGQSTAG